MTDNCNPVSQKRAGFCSSPPPTMKKTINYLPFIVLLLLPSLFYPVVDASGWRSSSDVHAFFEFASSLLAVTAGIMVLLHFFTTGRWFFLIISIGFTLIGTEQIVHAIFSFNRIWREIPPTFRLAVSTTWLTGHFILLAAFFLALIFREKEVVPAKRALYAVVYSIIGLVCAALIALLIFNSPILPHFVLIGSITKKLIELSLALLYFVAFLFYSNIYFKQQSHSPLLWGIIACIILRVLAHIFVFDSQAFYDAHWDTAHLIALLSYFFPIFGVWGETIKLQKTAQVQLIELEKEMAERRKVELELLESEERLRDIVLSTSDWVWEVDENGVYTYSSQKGFDILGRSNEDIIGKTPFDFMPPDEAKRAAAIFSEIAANKAPIKDLENLNIGRNDKKICLLTNGVPILDKEGNLKGYRGIDKDITEHKKIQEVLRENEERFRAIADYTYDWENWIGSDGKLVWINPSVLRLTGYTADECLNMYDFPIPLFDENDRERMTLLFAEVVRGASCDNVEFRIRCKDGSIKWGEVSCQPIYNSIGTNIGHRSSIRDVTDRKQAEDALCKSEYDLTEAQRLAKIGSWRFDVSTNTVRWSDELYRVFDVDRMEFGGLHEPFLRRVHPEDRIKVLETNKKTVEGGEPFDLTYRILTKTNQVKHIREVGYAMKDDHGNVTGLFGTAQDITDRKFAEETLAKSEEKYRTLFETIDEAFCVVEMLYDPDGKASDYRFVEINPAFEKHTGLQQALGKTIRQMVPNHDAHWFEIYGKVARTGEAIRFEMPAVAMQRYYDMYAFRIGKDGSQRVGVLFNDITPRKQAEEALHASLKEKELLIREVHHRVKNNMQVMSGLLDLQARFTVNPKLNEMLNEGKSRIRAMSLIHEKLYESKDFTRIDLAEYVKILSQELFQAYKINPGKIDLVIQTDDAAYVDISHAIPCGLILNELISNALKHAFPGDEPGKLEIAIHETKNTEIEILVRDNGSGIPEEVDIHQPHLVGLYLVNGLVKNQLYGQIEVIRGIGTEFRIRFPLLFVEDKGVVQ
jgi:PAS domain S-box-containing protein